jgi:hypothetical protein
MSIGRMTHIRKSSVFLSYLLVNLCVLFALFVHAMLNVREAKPALEGKSALVRSLGLTDLCLFSEASYTRHLSLADFSTPFQDCPLSLEHFPSGSVVEPPEHLREMAPGDADR